MITLMLKGGPLDGLELHNIPVTENSDPSLVKFQEIIDEVHVLSQGLYTFEIVGNQPHAIHVPSEKDKKREPVPVVVLEKKQPKVFTKEEKIAVVVKLYEGVMALNAKKARELRPRMLETLIKLEAQNPEALLPDGPD